MQTEFYSPARAAWQIVDVRGTKMEEAKIARGEFGVWANYYRLAEGMEIRSHRHEAWVLVTVLQGRMQVCEDAVTTIVEAGDCYFVPPNTRHVERALVDTLVLVTEPQP
jgi:quercetin dioxygenase-like cupin family protein